MSTKSVIVEEDVAKNDNSFSFISTAFDLVGNKEFKAAEYDVLCSNVENRNTYVWQALSAVGEKIGTAVHESILNYIDNVANIDTCNVRALQSMIKTIGTNYTTLKDINSFPLEVQNYIDIFSLQRELLLNSEKIKKTLADKIQISATFDSTQLPSAVLCANEISTERAKLLAEDSTKEISSNWFSDNQHVEMSSGMHIDDDKLDCVISSALYDLLMDKLHITYNDASNTYVFQEISTNILTDDFEIRKLDCYKSNIDSIANDMNKYAIANSFNVQQAADNILNMISSYDDYSKGEQIVINDELKLRSLPFKQNENATKYRYYKELKLKEYVNFIELQYTKISEAYDNAKIYEIDSNYLELSGGASEKLLFETNDGKIQIRNEIVEQVVSMIVSVINNIRTLRQQLKSECQRYYMKGAFLLIAHIINQYLLDNIAPTVFRLTGTYPEYNSNTTYSEITEYEDTTNYFNISCENDLSTDKSLNKRYWESDSNKDAIGAIDNTNLFETLPTVNANDDQFNGTDVESFYLSTLNNVFEQYTIRTLSGTSQSDHLNKFLSYIFNLQADSTYRNDDNMLMFSSREHELSSYKTLLFKEYIGQADGNTPYYYFTNKIHPSYQIHPYLSSFVEITDYTFAIENITNVAIDNVQKQLQKNIDNFIDDDGYLINTYRNPLNTNTDYQSRYEFTDNVNKIGMYDPVVAYDGWLFPDGYNVLTSIDPSKYYQAIEDNIKYIDSNESNPKYNYYYGLDLTINERKKVVRQIETFRQQISAIAEDKSLKNGNRYVVYRYALDSYNNAYILLKDKTSANNLDDAPGELWIRLKDSPLPFLAYAFESKDDTLANAISQSQLTYVQGDSAYEFDQVTQHSSFQNDNLYRHDIYDFYMSNSKKEILFRCKKENDKECIIRVQVAEQYVAQNDTNILKFSKADNNSAIIADDTTENDFKFLSWYEYDNHYIMMYSKYADSKLYIKQYANPSIASMVNQLVIGNPCPNIKDGIKPTITLVDNKLAIGYISDVSMNELSLDAPAKNNINYANIESTLTNPLETCLVAHNYIIDDRFTAAIPVGDKKLFNGFSDIGTFGIFEENNEISATKITQYKGSFYNDKTELNKRGIFKFQLIGVKPKYNGIDFKFTLPLRMHEDEWYEDNTLNIHNEKGDLIKLVNLLAVRYDESTDRTIHSEGEGEAGAIYEPFKLKNLAAGRTINARIDEALSRELQSEFDSVPPEVPLCSMIDIPYLMVGDTANVELPTRFINPGTQSENYFSDNDNCIMNIFEGHVPLSVSWVNNKGKIKLDFNSCYYNRLDSNYSNKYNLKHLFLNLDSPGDAGYLNTITIKNEIRYDALYYIKNISDQHPKFLLSAMIYDIMYPDAEILCMNEGTKTEPYVITMNESTDESTNSKTYVIRIK